MFKKPSYKKTEHGFIIIENLFSLRERWMMKRQLCPLVMDLNKIYDDGFYPGLQSPPNLYEIVLSNNYFNFYEKLFKYLVSNTQPTSVKIIKSWVTHQDKNTGECWHTHEYSAYSCVYYLTNPENKGTMVEIDGKIFTYEAKENSLIILPGHIKHTPPRVNKKRYSVAIDFDIELLEE